MVAFIQPRVYLDLNDDADFSDANEDLSGEVRYVSWNRGRASVNDEFGMGTASVGLVNTDGKYSPFNTGSAIYPNLTPGRRVKIEYTHDSVTYSEFYGRLAEVRQGRSPDSAPIIELALEDDFGRLSRVNYRTPAAFLGVSVPLSALQAIIAGVGGYAAGMRSIETAVQTIEQFFLFNSTLLEAAKTLAKQELGGVFFIGRDGKWTFHNRNHASLAPVSATFTGPQALSMAVRASDFYDEVVFKRAGLDVDAASTAIFQLFPAGRALQTGSTAPENTLHGEYIGAARDVVEPVAGTDYTANTLADGTGADVTNQVSVSAFTSYGGGFSITFDNASGAVAYLTEFLIRGNAIRQSDETREITVTGTGPVPDQTLRDSFDFNDDADAIRGYALFRLFAGTTFFPRRMDVRIIPRTDAEAAAVLDLELQDRVHITNTTGLYPSTIDEDYIVQGIAGRSIEGGQVEITLNLWHELAALATFFRISGASGAGQDHSKISAAAATVGDRIKF